MPKSLKEIVDQNKENNSHNRITRLNLLILELQSKFDSRSATNR